MSDSDYTPSKRDSKPQETRELEVCYQIAMEMLYADREWFRFPRWVHKLEHEGERLKDAALTLASLLSQSAGKSAVLRHDGWFEASAQQIEEDTGYSPDRQLDHIRKLVDWGLVSKQRAKQVKGRRLIRINYPLLVRKMLAVLPDEDRTKIQGVMDACYGFNPLPNTGKTRNTSSKGINRLDSSGSAGASPSAPRGIPSHREVVMPVNGAASLLPPKHTLKANQLPLDVEVAARIREVAQKVKRVKLYGKFGDWVDRVAVLRRQLEDGEERMQQVFGEDYHRLAEKNPELIVYSAKGLTDRMFLFLENKMKQERRNAAKDDGNTLSQEQLW